MPSVDSWDFVPHFTRTPYWDKMKSSREQCNQQTRNAYWYAHQKMNSKAKVHYGDVYDLPLELGNFDIVFMGMILPHLRDPFQAIYSASRLASEYLVVTNPGRKPRWLDNLFGRKRFQAKFIPSKDNNNSDVWWALSNTCIERMLETIGFNVVDRIESSATCNVDGKIKTCKNLAIVSRRAAGAARGK